jgi:predicted TIM-barrel fold metal-dependent hydrolase
MSFSRPDQAYNDSTRILDEGVAGAFLVSMAHMYTAEDFRAIAKTPEIERRLVAAENDFIAVSVARKPSQFIGFYSVNPLRDYAFDELKRCKANPNLTGLKLHLPACGVSLENPEHVETFGKVLAWAAENDVPVLLHLTAGEEIDLEKANWIWKTIIQPHERLHLYLAHLGSVGGFNSSSGNLLRAHSLLADKSAKFREMKIYFDLSGAIMEADSEEGRPTTDEQCRELSELIARVGVERFLFASDYPVFSVSRTRANLASRLKLTPEDSAKLLSNRSPLFQH